MTVKRKKRNSGFPGGKGVTVAFSLCLLAAVAMIGMYTVGRTEEKQKRLEQEVAEAQQEKAREEARQKELAEARQEAASAAARRQKEAQEKKEEEAVIDGAELESEFEGMETEVADAEETEEIQEASGTEVTAEQPTLSFSPDTDKLMWPLAGNILLDYSMDKSIYFSTLDQYKYNPAVIIQGTLDESVMSAAQGKVVSVETLEETGTTVTMDIGDGYQLIYGQLKELPVKEGDYVKAGETIGYVSEPTRYYSKEGCNLYFAIQKDGESLDPMTVLQ